MVVRAGRAIHAFSLVDLYLLLSSWASRSIAVVQADVDLQPFRALEIPGITWEGSPSQSPDLFITVPSKDIRKDDTLNAFHAWLLRLRQSEPLRVVLERLVVEAVDNALEHSHSSAKPVLAASFHGNSLACAIMDAGRGVRQALADNPHHAGIVSDVLALRQALKEGVSGVGKPGRGSGLPSIQKAISGNNGTLVFRSLEGEVVCGPNAEGTFTRSQRVPSRPGTQVLFEIPKRA